MRVDGWGQGSLGVGLGLLTTVFRTLTPTLIPTPADGRPARSERARRRDHLRARPRVRRRLLLPSTRRDPRPAGRRRRPPRADLPTSPVHLAYISPISRPYLAYISPISRPYISQAPASCYSPCSSRPPPRPLIITPMMTRPRPLVITPMSRGRGVNQGSNIEFRELTVLLLYCTQGNTT